MSAEHALNEFLKQYVDDQSSGKHRGLDEYQALFPGHGNLIAEHYARYEGERSEAGSDPGASLPEVIGPYRILAELGRGGQGVVYLAEDDRLHRKVALKVLTGLGFLTRDRIARFLREAEVASRLDHPGIATVYEIGTEAAAPYIAMRYVEGETLARQIAAAKEPGGRGRPVAEVVQAAEKAARALHAAHEAGVIHRDVKPGNILIPPSGDPVIVDFGLAHDADGSLATITRTGDFFGTPAYMSPEQISTQGMAPDRRTDVWSLGATLYEWLTLRRPFDAPTREGLYQAIMTKGPPDPRLVNEAIPGDLKLVLETALEKDRDRRYQTALDLAEDLRRVRMHEPILAKPVGRFVRLRRFAQRNPALASALAGLFFALVTGLTIALVLLDDARRERDTAGRERDARNIALTEKAAALTDYDRLGDLSRLEELVTEVDTLWPAGPTKVAAMRTWLEQASDLEKRLPGHQRVLDRLRKSALPCTDEDLFRDDAPETRSGTESAPASRRANERLIWKFESSADQFKHDTTAKLVADLTAFVDPKSGLLSRVERRLAFAESLHEETIGKYQAQWTHAIRSISDPGKCPKYGGLEIKPQLGLIPIGRDPASGLWEFSHLATTAAEADPVPNRDGSGRLVVTEWTGLVFVLIPGGTFRMGATKPDDDQAPTDPNVDPQAIISESPITEIALEPFFMSKYEMTQGQWARFAQKNPSQYGPGSTLGGNVVDLRHPVEQVNWEECNLWLGRLGLVLPTEAQWEYAARGGTTTPRWTGIGTDGLAKNANVADAYARLNGAPSSWKCESWDDGYTAHAPAGSFPPNPFGLHEVLGNVWEWCRDSLGGYGMAARPGDGLRDRPGSRDRVFRGGSFRNDASYARSAARSGLKPDFRSSNLGVRPARVVDR